MSLRFLLNRSLISTAKTFCKPNIAKYATFDLEKIAAAEKATPTKKKTTPIPKITLISPGDNITITTLVEAQKISKRRDLKLVKVIDLDTKTQRPVYRLMTGAEYHAEDLKQRNERKEQKKNESSIKGDKLLTISARISDHDLESRIRNIIKWTGKLYEVRVVITSDSENISSAENIYTKMVSKLPDLRFLQKRQKGSELRFQILPPKRDKNSSSSSSPDNEKIL